MRFVFSGRQHIWKSAIGLFLLATLFADIHAAAQGRVRVIPHGYGQSLASRLEPNDEVVVVTRTFDVVLPDHDLSPSEALQMTIVRSNFAGVVDVSATETALTEDDTWVRTCLKGRAIDVFKASRRRVRRSQHVTLCTTGGEIKLGHVTIRAGVVQSITPGQHLLFGEYSDSGQLTLTYVPLAIKDGQLSTTWPPDQRRDMVDPLDHMSAAAAIDVVRKQAKARQ
jgi:hypothetical protein